MAVAAILLTGCAGTGSSPSASLNTAQPGPTASPAATRSAAPSATVLPGGLALRPGLPPLVDGEAAACVPGCGLGREAGGALPAGRYQTRWFFGGYMTIETDGTWSLGEDSNAELSLPTADNYQIAFALDPQLVLHGAVAEDVPLQASAYTDWLSMHPDLVVSDPEETLIGSVPATAVDISLAPDAGQDEADCGTDSCITFISNPAIPSEFQHVDGILGDDVYRFYFADVSYSGTDHLFVVKVEGRDEADVTSPRVEQVLHTVVIPARQRQPF